MSSPPPLRPPEDVDASAPPRPKPPEPPLDINAIVSELGLGRYQVQTFALILPPILCCAVYMAQFVFNAAAVDHRCLVPECEGPAAGWAAGPWAAWALPGATGCQRYRPARPGASCAPEDFTTDRQSCERRVYQDYDYSIVATFDLGCAEWKRTMVGSVHTAGMLVALPVTGFLSDRFGRRSVFVGTATVVGLVGLARSFAPSYGLYLTLELLESAVGSGVYTCGFILAMELLPPAWRVLGGNVISCVFALGQALCALAASVLPDWQLLTRALYAPSLLFVGLALLLPESVRWLLTRGRVQDAAKIIFRAAEVNGIKLSPAAVAQLTRPDGAPEQSLEDKPGPKQSLLREIVRSRIILSRLALCSFWWVTVTLVYYGLSINAVSLAGDRHLNYALSSLVELPGYALSVLTLDRFGRKRSIISAFSLCSLALLSMPFVPLEHSWASISLSMAGKLCISMAFSSVYIYTAELFPTAARHRLLAACSVTGRLGNLLAPQTPLLTAVAEWLPYAVFGAMALGSALLMTLAPETLRQVLPDTVRQAEDISRPAAAKAAP